MWYAVRVVTPTRDDCLCSLCISVREGRHSACHGFDGGPLRLAYSGPVCVPSLKLGKGYGATEKTTVVGKSVQNADVVSECIPVAGWLYTINAEWCIRVLYTAPQV